MITINATGDTTIHTAGKYCPEDILVKVPASGGGGGVIESVTCTLVEDGPAMDYMGQFYYLNDSGICTKKEVMTVGQNLMVMKNSIIVITGSTASGGVTYLVGNIGVSAYRVDGDFYIKANM